MRVVKPLAFLSIVTLLLIGPATYGQADPRAALAGRAMAAEYPSWKIAEMKDLDRNWGPEGRDGEHAFRPARAERLAVIAVPAWWGKGFRPAEGKVYNLRITYKDTATRPIVLSTHGGFKGYWSMGEVHRFGGSGDGTWKVANVPVSWDLICRKNVVLKGPSDMTEIGIEANKDLPVESIVVEEPGPDAAARYGQETRAWVALAQADKRANASKGEKQEAVIPEDMKAQAMVPYARTYLVPLMQNSAPQEGEAGAALKLRMARNEYEPATFGVYANGRDLKDVTFGVSDLTDGEGNKLSAEVECRTVEYSVVQAGGRRDQSPRYQMFPQRLWPMYPAQIAKGESHWFWVTVHTLGEKSRPGKYSGKVEIKAEGATASLPIEVEVLPVTLLTMKQAGLELGGCSGPVPAQDLKCLAEHNHTGMDIWFGGTQPQIRVIDGQVKFDWSYLDDWMANAKRYGMDHMMWFMGGDPYGFPDTINLERDLYRATADGQSQELRHEYIEKLKKDPDKVLPEVRPRYAAFIRELAQHAKSNNWPSRLIIHPFDEPAKWVQTHTFPNAFHEVKGSGAWIKPHFEDACAIIREAAKGYDNIETGGDMHHAQPSMVFLDDVDVFCTNAIHEDPQLNRHVTGAGVEFWQYSGTGDHTPAHQGRYTFGFFFGAYDARGSLIWAYDSVGRFDTSDAAGWGYGWYTPFGTVYTPFMVGVREGFDDRRWVETYKKEVGFAKAQPVLQPIDVAAIAQRTAGGRDTVSDFFAEMKRVDMLNVWRDQVIDALVEAKGAGEVARK